MLYIVRNKHPYTQSRSSGKTRFKQPFLFEICWTTWIELTPCQLYVCENRNPLLWLMWLIFWYKVSTISLRLCFFAFSVTFVGPYVSVLHHHVAQVQGSTQDHLQIFNIEMKAKMKSHLMPEQVGIPICIFKLKLWDCSRAWFSHWDSQYVALMSFLCL